jgi:glucose/arabinose dehydrogenase
MFHHFFGKSKTKSREGFRPRLESLEDRTVPATLPAGFREATIASGLLKPTAMEIAPDGRIFVTQQDGAVRVIKNGQLLATPFTTFTDINSEGERGVLGVTFDPNFASNHFVYVYHTTTQGSIHNRVSRFVANGDVAQAGSETTILDLDTLNAANHNGGAIHFGKDGKLYVAVGDNASGSFPSQRLDSRFGKMLRINADGSIPTDNPFYTTTSGVNRSIWAYGLRNPFTFAVQPRTGRIFINDVGTSTYEEINDGRAGGNYGYITTEGPTTDPRFISPIFYYAHGYTATTGHAITGGAFYNTNTPAFPRAYYGTYFYTDLVTGWIRSFNPTSRVSSAFATGLSAPVDLKVGMNDGLLYYLVRGSGDNTGALVAIRFVKPDLNWSRGGLGLPSSVNAGTAFHLVRTYTVNGTAFASDFRIRYVASTDSIIGNADDFFVGLETVTSATAKSPGLRSELSPAISINRRGTFHIIAVLDSLNEIPETLKTNNVFISSATVRVS